MICANTDIDVEVIDLEQLYVNPPPLTKIGPVRYLLPGYWYYREITTTQIGAAYPDLYLSRTGSSFVFETGEPRNDPWVDDGYAFTVVCMQLPAFAQPLELRITLHAYVASSGPEWFAVQSHDPNNVYQAINYENLSVNVPLLYTLQPDTPVLSFIGSGYPQDIPRRIEATIEVKINGNWVGLFDHFGVASRYSPTTWIEVDGSSRMQDNDFFRYSRKYVIDDSRTNTYNNTQILLEPIAIRLNIEDPMSEIVGQTWGFSSWVDTPIYIHSDHPIRDMKGEPVNPGQAVLLKGKSVKNNVTFTAMPCHYSPTGYTLALHGDFEIRYIPTVEE